MDRALTSRAAGFPVTGIRTSTPLRSTLFTGALASVLLFAAIARADDSDGARSEGALSANSAIMVPTVAWSNKSAL